MPGIDERLVREMLVSGAVEDPDSTLLKLASKGLNEALEGRFGESDSAGVDGDCVCVVDPAESSTSSEGMGEGGNGFAFDATGCARRLDRGRRRKGSHSLEGLGEIGQGASMALGG